MSLKKTQKYKSVVPGLAPLVLFCLLLFTCHVSVHRIHLRGGTTCHSILICPVSIHLDHVSVWGYLKKLPPCQVDKSSYHCHVHVSVPTICLPCAMVSVWSVSPADDTCQLSDLLQKSRLTHVSPYFSQKSRRHVSLLASFRKSQNDMVSFLNSPSEKVSDTCHSWPSSEKANHSKIWTRS